MTCNAYKYRHDVTHRCELLVICQRYKEEANLFHASHESRTCTCSLHHHTLLLRSTYIILQSPLTKRKPSLQSLYCTSGMWLLPLKQHWQNKLRLLDLLSYASILVL